jgi:phage terminase small subunit
MRPPAPEALEAAGRKMWAQVWADVLARGCTFGPDEVKTLELACSAWDRVVFMRRELGEAPSFMVEGAAGQRVLHPLVGELRQTEAHVSRMLAALKIAGADGGDPPVNQNRAAGQSRWAAAHG